MEMLRCAGLRPTRQRLALARLLFDSGDRHVTAEKLHEEAIAANIAVSLATIYNTLHQFTAAGLLREIIVDASRSYFDTNINDHHHFFHEPSGRLEDIPGEQVVVAELPPAPPGTAIRRVEVIVRLSSQEITN
jgi:Fe2+/Zn2+ uptake regulation proteins